MDKHNKIDTVYLYPTLRCNLNCSMCVSSANLHDSKFTDCELTLDQYIKLINDLYSMGVRVFDISGGEPLLRGDLLKILEEIKKKEDTQIVMVSNGTLWNTNQMNLEQLLGYLDDVHFSIDSSDAKTHDLIRGVEGTFQLVRESVKRIREYGYQNVNINTVLSTNNYLDVYNILTMAKDFRAKSVSFLKLLDVTESSKRMDHVPGEKEYLYVFDEIVRWMNEKYDNDHNVLVKLVLPGILMKTYKKHKLSQVSNVKVEFDPLRGCNAFRKSIMITSNGYVTGCTAFLGKENFYAGNVVKDDWDTILSQFSSFREMIKKREASLKTDKCQGCQYWNVCKGGCPAIAFNYDGVFENPDVSCRLYNNLAN